MHPYKPPKHTNTCCPHHPPQEASEAKFQSDIAKLNALLAEVRDQLGAQTQETKTQVARADAAEAAAATAAEEARKIAEGLQGERCAGG